MAASWESSVAEHKQRLRAEIIRTAMELVGERGMAGVTMSLLAERTGITRKTLYSYFPDLEHVLLARVSDEVDRYMEGLAAELAAMTDPMERLRHYVTRQLRYFARPEHGAGTAVFEAAGLSQQVYGEVERHLGRLADPLIAIVADGVEAGVLRPDLDGALVADGVLKLMGTMRAAVMTGERTPEAATDELLGWVLDGIRAPRRPG